ncbi:MAG: hypothetical protein J6D03_00355 [Clostridia bacterium]|nr:hypothetical protein [Clostridia bacterium]
MATKKCMVFETLGSVKGMTVNESGADGLMRISGVFGVCGVKNGNNRIYDKSNYAKMVETLQRQILSEGCPGELEHPNSMNIDLNNVSHKIESIEMNEDGTITGTVVLLNTRKGKDAQAMIEGGLPLYISSRGAGSIDESGHVTLSTIKTYDLVGTPGFSQAKLTLKKNQTFESLNESLEDGNIMYAIVENEDEDPLGLDSKDDKKKKDNDGDSKESKKHDDKDSSEDEKPKKKDNSEDEDEKSKKKEKEKEEGNDKEKSEPKPKKEETEKDNKDTDKVNMEDLKNSIDKLTERITSLEAGMHIAKESLKCKNSEIQELNSRLAEKDRSLKYLEESVYDLTNRVDDLSPVDYGFIEHAINESVAAVKRINGGNNNIDNIDDIKEEILDEALENIQKWATKSLLPSIESWVNEEYTPEIKKWVCEDFASGVQDWIVEEYSDEIQKWVCEDFAPNVQEWICEEFAPNIEEWICEEFAPEIEGWVNEEFAPQIEGWITEEFAPANNQQVNENVSAYIESQKQNKYDSIDRMLTALEESKNNVDVQTALASLNTDKYSANPIVEGMPAEYKPMWEMLNEERKNEILRQARAYDFTKKGVMESFWATVKFKNNESKPVNENIQPTYHNAIINQMKRLRH